MSELSLYTLTQLRIACRYGRSAVARGSARVARRLQREQTGQDVLEYAGMIVLVAAVIALLFTLNVPSTIATAVAHAVNSIVSNGSSSYTPPKAIQDPTKT
jgi:Flp pilus assembly pilin Flp